MKRIYIARCVLWSVSRQSVTIAGVLSKRLNGSSWFSACENLYFSLVLSYFAALYWNSCITVIPSRTLSQTLNLAVFCFFSRRHATVESVANDRRQFITLSVHRCLQRVGHEQSVARFDCNSRDLLLAAFPKYNLRGLMAQVFWATVTSNGSPYAMGPLSVLSVCNVGVLNIAKRLHGSGCHLVQTTAVGLGPGHIALDETQLPLHRKGYSSPSNFRPTLLWHGPQSQQLLSSCLQVGCQTTASKH